MHKRKWGRGDREGEGGGGRRDRGKEKGEGETENINLTEEATTHHNGDPRQTASQLSMVYPTKLGC